LSVQAKQIVGKSGDRNSGSRTKEWVGESGVKE
jgi:hypothetical protein